MSRIRHDGIPRRLVAASLAFGAFWAALVTAHDGMDWLAALDIAGGVSWMFWGKDV